MTDPNKANEPQDSDDFDADWAAAMAEQQAGEESQTETNTADNEASTEAATTPAEDTSPEMGSQAAGLEDLGDDWAAALAEQTAGEASGEDDWAAAMAEQAAAEESAATSAPEASTDTGLFKPFDQGTDGGNSDIDLIMDIPVQLSVELGRTRLTLKHILQLGQGSVVELDGLAGEPMDIFVNGYLIAQGEVVVVEEKYGIRITDIVTPSDRIQRLNTRRR